MTASAMRNKLCFVSNPNFLCILPESMKLWQANVLGICRINFQIFHISCPTLPYAYHSFITSSLFSFFFFNVISSLRLQTPFLKLFPSHTHSSHDTSLIFLPQHQYLALLLYFTYTCSLLCLSKRECMLPESICLFSL